jgi:hypothetical protein
MQNIFKKKLKNQKINQNFRKNLIKYKSTIKYYLIIQNNKTLLKLFYIAF